MARQRPTYCKICGAHEGEPDPHRPEQAIRVSWRGKCQWCGNQMHLSNTHQLRAHSGPMFDHWRRRSVAAYGGVLVDARRDEA